MKKLFASGKLLLVTLIAGVVGFLLQLWLLRTTDGRGLVSPSHISSILSFVLTGVFLLVLALYLRQQKPLIGYHKLFADGLFPALGSVAAAVGILYIAIATVSQQKDILTWLVLGVGVIAAGCAVVLGLLRLQKKRPHPLFQGGMSFFFAIYTLNQYRTWCKEPQMVVFFFPLLACIFLMLGIYHGAALDAQKENCRRYVFFNRAALFCCCLALCQGDWIFYLTMGLYMACSIRLFPATKREVPESDQ